MADAIIQLGYFTVAEFSANPNLVLEHGQHLHLSNGTGVNVDAYKIGDGSTQLSALTWKGVKSGSAPTEVEFTNQTGMGDDITLPAIPTFCMVFNGSGQKLKEGLDYTITGDQLAFLYVFEETTTITVIIYQ